MCYEFYNEFKIIQNSQLPRCITVYFLEDGGTTAQLLPNPGR